MFRTSYDRLKTVSNPGSGIKNVYRVRLDKNGNRVVEKKGEENRYSYIQSFADSCDINLILKKFTATGDESLLVKHAGAYLDLTEMPTDYFDMVNKLNQAREEFNHLPYDVKKKFDFDADKFIASIGTDKWYEALSKDVDNNGVINRKDLEATVVSNNQNVGQVEQQTNKEGGNEE